MKTVFSGPIFIVGMPRSGTKLLRSLLNNHSKIAIPIFETEILPYWVNNWKEFGDLTDFNFFERFYNKTEKGAFFYYSRKSGKRTPSVTEWYNACRGEGTVAAVFEALVRLQTGASDDMIWGDKSPSYITHIPLLKKLYPQAKIIHIVRDVRDYCLSSNKAWGKNIMRAAQRWADDVSMVRQNLAPFSQDIFELRFKDLLDDPENLLQDICNFLEIEFEKNMTVLTRPSENIGAAKGQSKIVISNKDKWRQKMSPKLVRKIEQLCQDELLHYGYSVAYHGPTKRLSNLQMKWLRILDGIHLVLSDNNKLGIWRNLLFHIRYSLTSGNSIKSTEYHRRYFLRK